ncbi:hypothetical protein AB0H45_34835, partial [Streptomyces atroolivaceus]
IARLWVEFMPSLEPGGQASVRLAPLDPSQWQHLQPGQMITMHEDQSVAGTAVVLEVQRPRPRSPHKNERSRLAPLVQRTSSSIHALPGP